MLAAHIFVPTKKLTSIALIEGFRLAYLRWKPGTHRGDTKKLGQSFDFGGGITFPVGNSDYDIASFH